MSYGPSRGSRGGGGRSSHPYSRGGDRRGDYEEEVIEISTNRLYVHNLSWRVSWQDLKDHFKQFGRVVFVDIARDAQTGKSMGRGIVRFDDADSAARAVQFGDGSIFMGRDLNVREDRMMAQQGLHVQPPLPPMQPGGLPPQAVAAGAGDA